MDTSFLASFATRVGLALEAAGATLRKLRASNRWPTREDVAPGIAEALRAWDPQIRGVHLLDDETIYHLSFGLAGVAERITQAESPQDTERP